MQVSVIDDPAITRRARTRIARRRGALTGLVLVVLGAWGALIPFVGPYFHYAYTPDHTWRWTASRGWLEVLPGAVTALGGLVVLMSARRSTAVVAAWLAAAAGAWFAIGISFVPILHTGVVGAPTGAHPALRVVEAIGFFYGLGVVIVFFAGTASGRLSVRSLSDLHVAGRNLDEETSAQRRTDRDRDTYAETSQQPAERVPETAAEDSSYRPNGEPLPADSTPRAAATESERDQPPRRT
jgi:hypothetical protein